MPKVLIVDDSQVIQDVIGIALRLNKYDVLRAANGIAALGYMAMEHPDVVLLDIGMPYMDGVAFVDELEKCHLRTCPIIVMTALPHPEYQGKVIATQPDAVLEKPFHLDTLLMLLEQVMQAA